MSKVLTSRLIRAELANNVLGDGEDWAKVGKGKHLEPGIVTYDNEDGSKTKYLLTREAIAALRPSAVGKPIIGKAGKFDHMKVNVRDANAGKYDGDVIESYDGGDGWEWIKFLVRDPETREKCRDGYQFSCAYIPESDGQPGLWHNEPYDEKIVGGEYTHFAVVPTPRYEGATIELLNSKAGGIVNKTLKSVLAAFMSAKDVSELANAMAEDEKKKEADEKTRKEKEAAEKKNAADAEKAKAKAGYEEAMKNARDDFERKALTAAYNAAMGDGEEKPEDKEKREKQERVAALRNEADALEKDLGGKPPLGGGDAKPEPGMPGHEPPKTNALGDQNMGKDPLGKTDPEAARIKAEQEKKNAEDAEAKRKKEEQEKTNALQAELAAAWIQHGEDLADKIGVKAQLLLNAASNKPLSLAEQPEPVRVAWAKAHEAAHAEPKERTNSLGGQAKTAREARNAKVKEEALKEAQRVERFNSLRAAAADRGVGNGLPSVSVVTLQEKADLGRQRYGSC